MTHFGGNENQKPDNALPVSEPEIKIFISGAKRGTDADNTRFDMLPFRALELASRTLAAGAKQYGNHNWEKGLPIDDTLNHAIRHIYKYLDGDTNEPHLTHALVNLMFCCHFDYEKETEAHKQ